MDRIYHRYENWECFKNGMYDSVTECEETLINSAVSLLKDEVKFLNISIEVMDKWKISTDVNLSNKSQNRQSWVGQSACSFLHNVPEVLTRIAWSRLTNVEKLKANLIADKIIRIYENKSRKIYIGMEKQVLF